MANKRRKKSGKAARNVLLILAILIVGVALTVRVLRDRIQENYGSDGSGKYLTATVERGSISTTVSADGTLVVEDLTEVTIPSDVEIDEFFVEEGDVVTEGQTLARVNRTSVIKALSSLQTDLDSLDEELEEVSDEKLDSALKTNVAGRVKAIYAQVGDAVTSVMYEHKALAILSLDGYMAVEIEADAEAKAAVKVITEDGKSYAGTVDSAADGKITVLVTDNGPKFEEQVTVTAEDGAELGKGTLYIHEPLTITGYAGTINRVQVKENQQVRKNTTIFTLKDTAYTANYENLLRERAELETKMETYVRLYQTGVVVSPMAGTVEETYETTTESYSASSGQSSYANMFGMSSSQSSSSSSADSEDEDEITVVTLCPEETMSVDLNVDETDILSLELGQEASVYVESTGGTYSGAVSEIQRRGSGSSGVTRYTVTVTLPKDAAMLEGMTASVSIRIAGVDDALLIPKDALTNTRRAKYVYTAIDEESGELSGRVEITTGMEGSEYTEILSGLTEGQTVYYEQKQSSSIFDMFSSMGSMGGMGGMSGGFSMGNQGGNNRNNNNRSNNRMGG